MTLPTEGAAALVARLRDGLSGVTPGPWVLDGHNLSAVLHCVTPKGHPDAKHLTGDYITVARCENTWRADAPFIAACSPDNIRALLDHIAAQEAALSTLAGERDSAERALLTVQNAAKTIAAAHGTELEHLRQNASFDHSLRAEVESLRQHNSEMTDALLASEARATALEGERDAEREQAESFKAMYHQACEWRDVKITALEAQLARAREDTIAECISVIERVGNWGDYKRDELTKDFGQPRFDMWTEIVEALRSIPAPADGRGDQMFASPSCPQEPVKDETAWLVELKGSTPSWAVCFAGDYDDHWTTDSTKALRFARKADAEAFIAWNGWTEAFASEHMWDDARTALLAGTPPSGAETQEKVDGN